MSENQEFSLKVKVNIFEGDKQIDEAERENIDGMYAVLFHGDTGESIMAGKVNAALLAHQFVNGFARQFDGKILLILDAIFQYKLTEDDDFGINLLKALLD